ncbi:MAG TPA: RHS repeat-associated core domain-containing protein, partial [Parvularculaceae bacterium]|nr:RHS repeat-associated core domain-containing protein [Parvularculaceae bacterium]
MRSQTTRGFTGQEMVDDVGLVNLNGRVYDPSLGRFISADPFIHDVTDSQDLNRYTYVHNNPLSYTDTNGYGFFKWYWRVFKKLWRRVARPFFAFVAAAVLQQYYLPPLLTSAGVPKAFVEPIAAGISGGTSNVITSGQPKTFLSGFGQAVATFGVGHGLFANVPTTFGTTGYFEKAIAHGVIGGSFSYFSGGKFSSGFLAAGFSSLVEPFASAGLSWDGAAFHAIAGGVGSILGGGKFLDGAITGTFTYLYNDALQDNNICRTAAGAAAG